MIDLTTRARLAKSLLSITAGLLAVTGGTALRARGADKQRREGRPPAKVTKRATGYPPAKKVGRACKVFVATASVVDPERGIFKGTSRILEKGFALLSRHVRRSLRR